MYTFNLSMQEAEEDGSLWVPNQPGLHNKRQDSQDYIVRLSQNNMNNKNKNE